MKKHMLIARLVLLFVGMILCGSLSQGSSIRALREIDALDNPDILNPKDPVVRNLRTLNEQVPLTVRLNLRPWADGAWRTESGIIANRYTDPGLAMRRDWSRKRSYIEERSIQRVLKETNERRRASLIDGLSAAEKYDLLVGDHSGSLTRAQWNEGERFYSAGRLESWMGICEGSAAASAIYPEPKHEVALKTPDGDTVRFHILDIKGLAALLWSAYNTRIPIVGTRCSTSSPHRDGSGAVVNSSCFDTNPGSLHLGILNFLGLRKAPVFINRVTSVQVWNVPIIGYQIRYFNLQNGRVANDLEGAVVRRTDFPKDRYRNFRSPKAESLVGVEMRVTIATGTTSSRDKSVSAGTAELKYNYDLELDSLGTVVGGEWYDRSHPDFMWAVEPDFRPLSVGDTLLPKGTEWDGGIVPAEWEAAIRQSSVRNQPMEVIVRKLVELSIK